MLAERRADWLPRYYPAGKLGRSRFLIGDADGTPGRSFPIPLRGPNRLVDFAGGFAGDDLALLGRAIGGNMGAAYKEALTFLGIAGKATAPRPPPHRSTAPPVQNVRNRELAQEIWRQTDRVRSSRSALDYLVCRRGLTSWDDDRVRWHPACPWGHDRAGCIVVPIASQITPNTSRSAAVGCTIAIWRIKPVMEGPVERRGLGPIKHNFAPVCVAMGDELAITEGVEDALAFHQQHGTPTWAALNAGNMADLILPERFRRVTIVQDNDPPDRNGRRPGPDSAQALRRRLQAEGREVRIFASDFGKDANDVLLQRAAQ